MLVVAYPVGSFGGGEAVLTVNWRVGRLVELRFAGNPSTEDAEQFERDAHTCIASCVRDTKRPVVICTDLRASHLFHPDVSERLIHTMRGATSNLQRNGLLGNGTALLALQLARFVKETTQDTRRRVFMQVDPLLLWLDELLIPAERARLRQFLEELDSRVLPPGNPTAVARVDLGGARPAVDGRVRSPRSRPR